MFNEFSTRSLCDETGIMDKLLTAGLETSAGFTLPSICNAVNISQSLAEHVIETNKQIPTAVCIQQHVHFVLYRHTATLAL